MLYYKNFAFVHFFWRLRWTHRLTCNAVQSETLLSCKSHVRSIIYRPFQPSKTDTEVGLFVVDLMWVTRVLWNRIVFAYEFSKCMNARQTISTEVLISCKYNRANSVHLPKLVYRDVIVDRPCPSAIGWSVHGGINWFKIVMKCSSRVWPPCGEREVGATEWSEALACSCRRMDRSRAGKVSIARAREPGRSGGRRVERPFRAIACNYRQSEESLRPVLNNGPSSPCSWGWALKCVQLRAHIQHQQQNYLALRN